MKIEYWFYIEPFANIFVTNKSVLVYNTLNGNYKEHPNELVINKIINKILLPQNNRVISITEKEINDDKILNFINDLRQIYVGDLLKKEWSKKKPTQLTPIINLQNDAERFIKKEATWVGSEMMDNFYELSIYINNFSNNTNNIWDYAYKQILMPYNEKNQCEIDYLSIVKIINDSINSSIAVINILGGNIFLHSEIIKIIDFLSKQNTKTIYHVDFEDISDNIDIIEMFNKINSYLSISVIVKYLDVEAIKRINISSFKNAIFKFIIENEYDLLKIENFIQESETINYSLNPIYNNVNIDFFKENIFTSKEDLFENKHSQLEIFQRKKINTNFFGKIVILVNGNAYSNVNNRKLGNIYKQRLFEIIYNEMYSGRSWLKTRKKVKPCNDCLYNLLCPPISNYEIIIGKMNLCTYNPYIALWQGEEAYITVEEWQQQNHNWEKKAKRHPLIKTPQAVV